MDGMVPLPVLEEVHPTAKRIGGYDELQEVQITARRLDNNPTNAIRSGSEASPDQLRNGSSTLTQAAALTQFDQDIAEQFLAAYNSKHPLAALNPFEPDVPALPSADLFAEGVPQLTQARMAELGMSPFAAVGAGGRVSGIVPLSEARGLPNTVSIINGMPSRGNYQIVANLPIIDGEVSGIPAYYSAYNTQTKTTDYVIGQTDLSRFLKSTAAYESMTYMRPYERESLAMMNSIAGGDVTGAFRHFGRSYVEAVQDPGWLLQMGTSIAGGSLARTAALRTATRERVLANVAETRAGNASSNFRTFVENEGRLQEALDIWPPNRGRLGPVETLELQVGMAIDRYGLPRGSFVSPEGTPFADRALPSSYQSTKPYFQYEVVMPIPGAIQSRALPWFGQRGLGAQFELQRPVQWYLDNEYLRVK